MKSWWRWMCHEHQSWAMLIVMVLITLPFYLWNAYGLA